MDDPIIENIFPPVEMHNSIARSQLLANKCRSQNNIFLKGRMILKTGVMCIQSVSYLT